MFMEHTLNTAHNMQTFPRTLKQVTEQYVDLGESSEHHQPFPTLAPLHCRSSELGSGRRRMSRTLSQKFVVCVL